MILLAKELDINGMRVYACEICGFVYRERDWAEKCEDHCAQQKACSPEITLNAIQSAELLMV